MFGVNWNFPEQKMCILDYCVKATFNISVEQQNCQQQKLAKMTINDWSQNSSRIMLPRLSYFTQFFIIFITVQ